jgi:hypothetical protein
VTRQPSDNPETAGPRKTFSRRNIFKNAAGVAAGAAGGSVLIGAVAAPAQAGTVKPAAVKKFTTAVAPKVIALTDAATITVNAALGNDFRVTVNGNRAMAKPTNPSDGQKIVFQVTQGTGGSFTITWDSSYEFSSSLPQPTLSSTAGQTDLLGFIYNAAKGTWLLAAFVNGFS